MTGRSERLCEGRFVSTRASHLEMKSFQEGRKKVAIISDAASIGISLHCSRDVRNQDPRYHILLEFPWSAERAIQQFGRTNRTNQRTPPVYLLLTTSVEGERRFSCSLAARVKQMGASTYANRALMDHLSLQQFDLFNEYGDLALKMVANSLRCNKLLAEECEKHGFEVDSSKSIERFFNRSTSSVSHDRLHEVVV